jgi:4'-phosphopantetheinyl transferase
MSSFGENQGIVLSIASLDLDPEIISRFETTLSPDEKARADRFVNSIDRSRFVGARGILRCLLAPLLKIHPRELEFEYGEAGKPLLSLSNAGAPEVQFNISHSSGYGAFAVARGRSVGVDIEQVRRDYESERIAERYFSAREVEELRGLPPEQRPEGFFNCWTRKEAYIKADGRGLQIRLDTFDVTLAPGKPAAFLRGVADRWHLACPASPRGYALALVYNGPPCDVSLSQVDPLSLAATLP